MVGNGAIVHATHVGTIELKAPTGLVIELDQVYFVPTISKSIISISCLDKDGFVCTFSGGCATLMKHDMIFASFRLSNGLYLLESSKNVLRIDDNRVKRQKTGSKGTTYLWHYRLGHINERRIKELHKQGFLGDFDCESLDMCESCLTGKMTKVPFTKKGERSKELLGLIHTDVCGPFSISARGGFRYFITFTDDFSRYGYVYLMTHKSDALERFKEFKNEVEN